MSTQHNEVRFRQGLNDAELWLKWRESHHVEIADSMLREYQKRDSSPAPEPEQEQGELVVARNAARAGVLYVDKDGIGRFFYESLRAYGLDVRELPTTNRS